MKITEIQERYSLKSRQSAYDRVNALKEKGIELSSESLDKLDEHLKSGGTLSDFAEVAIWREPDLGSTQIAPLPKEPAPIPQNQQETLLTIGEMTRLMEAIAQLRPPELLMEMRELENAAEKGWLLTSEQVRRLIGVKPVVRKGDHAFTRGSFEFVKSGKIGNQTAWQVVKVSCGGKFRGRQAPPEALDFSPGLNPSNP